MRIVSLDPSITSIIAYCGLEKSLVGVTEACGPYLQNLEKEPQILVSGIDPKGPQLYHGKPLAVEKALCHGELSVYDLADLKPDLVLTSLRYIFEDKSEEQKLIQNAKEVLSEGVKIKHFYPYDLDGVYSTIEAVTRFVKAPEKGHVLSQRIKAQVMDWSDNFYERIKHKNVVVLSSVNPLVTSGFWLPDLIKSCSCKSMSTGSLPDKEILPDDLPIYRPDVILVAPRGKNLLESMKTLPMMESWSFWENLPAVKRGEVYFCDASSYFYSWGPGIMDTMSIIVSAVGGMDSGYIAPRDSFQRLRWVEMQRHKIF